MRRLFWLTMGAAAGAGGTIWTQRKVRDRLETLDPDQVMAAAGRAAGKGAAAVGRTVVAAVGEGRTAMAEREIELRSKLHGPQESRTSTPVRRLSNASSATPRAR